MTNGAIFTIPITYDGKTAAEHKMDLFALGGSLQGVARVLAVTANFAVTFEFAKTFGAQAVKVYAQEAEEQCYSVTAVIEFVKQHQILSGLGGALLTLLLQFVIARSSNNREEMKLLSARLEQAIRELGNREQAVVDRMMTTIEKLADSLRPAVRTAVQPVGEECETLSLGKRGEPTTTVIDKATRDAILADEGTSLTELRQWRVVFTELDKVTQTGKVQLADNTSEARVKVEVSDPSFAMPDNLYVASLGKDAEVLVTAKGLLRDGELERLYVSDVALPR